MVVGLLPGGMAVHLFLDPPIEDLWTHLLESQDDTFEPLIPLVTSSVIGGVNQAKCAPPIFPTLIRAKMGQLIITSS